MNPLNLSIEMTNCLFFLLTLLLILDSLIPPPFIDSLVLKTQWQGPFQTLRTNDLQGLQTFQTRRGPVGQAAKGEMNHPKKLNVQGGQTPLHKPYPRKSKSTKLCPLVVGNPSYGSSQRLFFVWSTGLPGYSLHRFSDSSIWMVPEMFDDQTRWAQSHQLYFQVPRTLFLGGEITPVKPMYFRPLIRIIN